MGILKFCENLKVPKYPKFDFDLYYISLICTKFDASAIIGVIVPKDCIYLPDYLRSFQKEKLPNVHFNFMYDKATLRIKQDSGTMDDSAKRGG